MEEQWNYEDKRDEGKVNRLKPIHGILLFIVVMVSFYNHYRLGPDEVGHVWAGAYRAVPSAFGLGQCEAFESAL